MQITIGTSSLEVISAGARRLPSGKILVIIEVKQELISHDDLRAMFKGTTEDLVVLRDDGTKDTYGGCHYAIKVSDDVLDEVEIHRAEIECSSEADFQLGRMRGELTKQGTDIATQGTEIQEQKEVSEYLEQMSGSLLMAIDSLVLEVLPAAISEAVETAVKNAMESNNSEEEEVETEEGGEE